MPYPLKGTDYVLKMEDICFSAFQGVDINVPGGGSLWILGQAASSSLSKSLHLFPLR